MKITCFYFSQDGYDLLKRETYSRLCAILAVQKYFGGTKNIFGWLRLNAVNFIYSSSVNKIFSLLKHQSINSIYLCKFLSASEPNKMVSISHSIGKPRSLSIIR